MQASSLQQHTYAKRTKLKSPFYEQVLCFSHMYDYN